jgi:hypothetical protein
MDSLLVGIPHSIDCDGAVNASLMLTCETPPLAGCPIHTGGRLRQNGGRHQIGMLDGIRSEPWTPSGQNAWTASVRIRNLACRTPTRDRDHIFIRNIAPYRPFKRGDGVSSAVRCAMKRAGVVSPAKGAHVLRHTAATQMLRHGVPLDQIGLVLRHRGIDTTAYYAKADVNLLKEIAQPWPEVLP